MSKNLLNNSNKITTVEVREILGEDCEGVSDEELEDLLCGMRSMVSLLRENHEHVH